MNDTMRIKCMEMVRHIRDAQAEQLAGKSDAEIIAFFRYAGEKARQNAHRPQQRSVDARGRQATAGVGFQPCGV